MKILNKENIKWWGSQKGEIWAFKQRGDLYLLSPKKTKSAPNEETKTKLTQPQINWRQLAIFCVTGAIIGFAAFSLFLTYILLKNAL